MYRGDYFVVAQLLRTSERITVVDGPGEKQLMSYDEAWKLAGELSDSLGMKTYVCGFVNFTVPKGTRQEDFHTPAPAPDPNQCDYIMVDGEGVVHHCNRPAGHPGPHERDEQPQFFQMAVERELEAGREALRRSDEALARGLYVNATGWFQHEGCWHYMQGQGALCDVGLVAEDPTNLVEKLKANSGGNACLECLIQGRDKLGWEEK